MLSLMTNLTTLIYVRMPLEIQSTNIYKAEVINNILKLFKYINFNSEYYLLSPMPFF